MNGRGRRARLDDIARIADSLRATDADGGAAPDLTASILARVDASRPFLDRAGRRWLWAGRAGVAAGAVLVVAGFVLTQRWGGEAVELVSREAPLSRVVQSVQSDATVNLVNLRQSLDGVADEPAAIFRVMTAASHPTDDIGRSGADDTGASGGPRLCESRFVGPVLAPSRAAAMDLPTHRADGCGVSMADGGCRFKSPASALRSNLDSPPFRHGAAGTARAAVLLDDVSPLMVGRHADLSGSCALRRTVEIGRG